MTCSAAVMAGQRLRDLLRAVLAARLAQPRQLHRIPFASHDLTNEGQAGLPREITQHLRQLHGSELFYLWGAFAIKEESAEASALILNSTVDVEHHFGHRSHPVPLCPEIFRVEMFGRKVTSLFEYIKDIQFFDRRPFLSGFLLHDEETESLIVQFRCPAGSIRSCERQRRPSGLFHVPTILPLPAPTASGAFPISHRVRRERNRQGIWRDIRTVRRTLAREV